ncbi:hypothetical protein MTR67_016486 [Solanum verrucosum]|uniref:Uncharacterized protein n=1 Tax=Solanum verrucosum TaxID=315347 RepID=A0AAF0QGY0_SOLVR|nr:hypothetical protein MTR67_016486 [Solanum verrucosum]
MSMAAFIKLEDSPMFQKQVRGLEQTTDDLRDRCQKLYKGCKKYMEVLGESQNGDIMFAESLEAFGGGLDDPLSVSLGGPIIMKFISALRELATYKELIRSQVTSQIWAIFISMTRENWTMPEHTANLLSRWIRRGVSISQQSGGKLYQHAYGGIYGKRDMKEVLKADQMELCYLSMFLV